MFNVSSFQAFVSKNIILSKCGVIGAASPCQAELWPHNSLLVKTIPPSASAARENGRQTDVLKDLIRQVVSEQLANILQGGSVQPPPQQEDCAEEIENVFDFLDSF